MCHRQRLRRQQQKTEIKFSLTFELWSVMLTLSKDCDGKEYIAVLQHREKTVGGSLCAEVMEAVPELQCRTGFRIFSRC